jgi:CTP:molybdopterin cytidylyltransferase MocA
MARMRAVRPRPVARPGRAEDDECTNGERIAGLVLAAGAGRRFGGPKQLAPLDGRPLLEHALAAMAAALPAFAVVLGARAEEIAGGVDLHGGEVVVAADWQEGLAASLRAGVAALAPRADAIVVTLGDQPRLRSEAIVRVAAVMTDGGAADGGAARGGGGGAAGGPSFPAARAVYRDGPGHPVLLRRELFAAVAELRGDAGARELLAAVTVAPVPFDGDRSRDVDTPADLRTV